MTSKTSKSTTLNRRSLIAGGAALAAAPFSFHTARSQEATIKIGFPVPLTGPYGAEAQDQVRAAEVAIAEFNESLQFHRRPFASFHATISNTSRCA
jgi:branched-chain amino acid transport system substrate-binding protein